MHRLLNRRDSGERALLVAILILLILATAPLFSASEQATTEFLSGIPVELKMRSGDIEKIALGLTQEIREHWNRGLALDYVMSKRKLIKQIKDVSHSAHPLPERPASVLPNAP